MISTMEDRDIFIGSTRHCADKTCKKPFIVRCPSSWTYKIRNSNNTLNYYCCYTHWIKELRKREGSTKQDDEIQEMKAKEKKSRENKRRRERNNGHASDV